MDVVVEALRKTNHCMRIAGEHFARKFLLSEVTFDLKGTCAGQAVFCKDGSFRIRYNRLLLEKNPASFIGRTVPHEVAHVVARQLYGPKIKPHGVEWKAIMSDVFRADCSRTHTMDVSGVANREFVYRCECKPEIRLGKRMHAKVVEGKVYACRSCKAGIWFVRQDRQVKIAPVAGNLLVSSLGSPLTLGHQKKLVELLGPTRVEHLIVQGDACAGKGAVELAGRLELAISSLQFHRRRDSIPADLTHAVFFVDQPTAMQQAAIERLRSLNVRVRLLKHPK